MTEAGGRSASEAQRTVDEVTGLRRRTRRARQAFWFPLVVFGALILGSTPLYTLPPLTNTPDGVVVGSGRAPLGALAPGFAAGLFWLIGVPVAYVVTALFYLWRGHRRGVRTTWRAYVFVGLGLFVVVALLTVNLPRKVPGRRLFIRLFEYLPGDLVIRGLIPLLAIAVGFMILALAERSRAFGLFAIAFFAIAFFAVALTANLYDMSNLTDRLARQGGGPEVNNIVVGLLASLAGIGFGLNALLRSRRPGVVRGPSHATA
jgi:hypothetical protein